MCGTLYDGECLFRLTTMSLSSSSRWYEAISALVQASENNVLDSKMEELRGVVKQAATSSSQFEFMMFEPSVDGQISIGEIAQHFTRDDYN